LGRGGHTEGIRWEPTGDGTNRTKKEEAGRKRIKDNKTTKTGKVKDASKGGVGNHWVARKATSLPKTLSLKGKTDKAWSNPSKDHEEVGFPNQEECKGTTSVTCHGGNWENSR